MIDKIKDKGGFCLSCWRPEWEKPRLSPRRADQSRGIFLSARQTWCICCMQSQSKLWRRLTVSHLVGLNDLEGKVIKWELKQKCEKHVCVGSVHMWGRNLIWIVSRASSESGRPPTDLYVYIVCSVVVIWCYEFGLRNHDWQLNWLLFGQTLILWLHIMMTGSAQALAPNDVKKRKMATAVTTTEGCHRFSFMFGRGGWGEGYSAAIFNFTTRCHQFLHWTFKLFHAHVIM